jgi:O-succinylbenzoate synthase
VWPELDLGVPGSLRLVRVAVPLLHPHVWAGGSTVVRDVVLVRWTRPDGTAGWGECPTIEGYVTGGTAAAWQALVRLVPSVLSGTVRPAPAGEWTAASADQVSDVPVAALGALADAALDAALRAEGRSLAEFFGGAVGPLPRTAVVGDPRGRAENRLAAARAAEDAGAAYVKLKVDGGTHPDVIAAVVESVGSVAVDANGTLGRDLAEVYDQLGLVYVEQPFDPATGWEELADWQLGSVTAMALDEPLGSLAAVDAALAARSADVLSVKPARLGGLWAAADAVRRCAESDTECFVGGMVELGVHRAGAAAVAAAAAARAVALPTDLGPSANYVGADVCTPVVCDADGLLVVPDGPGIGVEVDLEVVDRFTTDRWEGSAD